MIIDTLPYLGTLKRAPRMDTLIFLYMKLYVYAKIGGNLNLCNRDNLS